MAARRLTRESVGFSGSTKNPIKGIGFNWGSAVDCIIFRLQDNTEFQIGGLYGQFSKPVEVLDADEYIVSYSEQLLPNTNQLRWISFKSNKGRVFEGGIQDRAQKPALTAPPQQALIGLTYIPQVFNYTAEAGNNPPATIVLGHVKPIFASV